MVTSGMARSSYTGALQHTHTPLSLSLSLPLNLSFYATLPVNGCLNGPREERLRFLYYNNVYTIIQSAYVIYSTCVIKSCEKFPVFTNVWDKYVVLQSKLCQWDFTLTFGFWSGCVGTVPGTPTGERFRRGLILSR